MGPEPFADLEETPIMKLAAPALHHQQSRVLPTGERMLCDQLGGEMVIEILKTHGRRRGGLREGRGQESGSSGCSEGGDGAPVPGSSLSAARSGAGRPR